MIAAVQQEVAGLLSARPDLFLVDVKVKPTNNLKVFIDGDQGVGIDDLAGYNRSLYRRIEELGWFPDGDFSLELSSPGLDEPLKLHRQYLRNIGRWLEVILADGQKVEGKLLTVEDEGVGLEETIGKGKKLEIRQHHILFENIKTTKIQIRF